MARVSRRWTVAEYHRMGEVGLLRDDERMELIEGNIIEIAPIGSEHAGHLNDLNRYFALLMARKQAVVAIQNPVALAEDSEPQPDMTLLRWRDDCYRNAHPRPDEVLLLIEVADSSVQDDRAVKVPLYARYGIPEFWLVNLPERRLEVYRDPQEGQYCQVTEYRSGTVSPAVFPEVAIEPAELFPSRS
ncbi:MAG: Uma2 family endonuclease [Candidatus Competibacteraceae bacterium]|nr:Uma2 family endonuclease [Candidatus Competibacteraceae bacterium]